MILPPPHMFEAHLGYCAGLLQTLLSKPYVTSLHPELPILTV